MWPTKVKEGRFVRIRVGWLVKDAFQAELPRQGCLDQSGPCWWRRNVPLNEGRVKVAQTCPLDVVRAVFVTIQRSILMRRSVSPVELHVAEWKVQNLGKARESTALERRAWRLLGS